jgi:hypothetical protein
LVAAEPGKPRVLRKFHLDERFANNTAVMPGPVPGIHAFRAEPKQDVDGRDDARP